MVVMRPVDITTYGSETILESALLADPSAIAVSPFTDDIFIADMNHHTIRKIDIRTRSISTVAGIPGG